MNKRLILALALGLTILNWFFFFAIFYYFPDLPPPGPVQRGMIYIMKVLAFPVVQLLSRLEGNPPYFYLSVPLMLLVNALVWAVVLERLHRVIRRISRRYAPA
jgi:hypothetical protein